MAVKSGFKECSRCGLRNKPTAKQCDFCGQRFDISDDWEQHIDALEQMGKSSSKVEITDEVSRLIEATMVRKEPALRKEPQSPSPTIEPVVHRSAPEPVRNVDAEVRIEASPTEPAIIYKAPEPVVQPERTIEIAIEPVLAPEAPLPAAIMADEQPSEPVAAHIETKKAEPQKRVKKSKIKTGPLSMFRFGLLSKDKAQLPFTIILFAGLAIYAVALILSSATLSTVGAWGMTIVAGTMMVVGFSRTMMVWDAPDEAVVPSSESTEDEEIIEMCPDCHEKVDPTDEKCPACGTEFEPSENR